MIIQNNPEKFSVGYRVGFNGLMPDNSIGLPQFMTYVQEASLFHTFTIPGAFDYYDKMGWVWILTHWQVEIAAYPKVGEKINIATWPVRFKGYFGERGFEAVNMDGKTILAANSNWILLDRSTLKPVRPNEAIAQKYGASFPFILQKDFALPALDGFVPLNVNQYTTTRRDIDTNNHVNNVKYLEWVFCHIPNEIYTGYKPTALKVAYKKETLLGETLNIKLFKKQSDLNSEIEIFAIIEKNGQIATEIHITLRKD